MKYDYSKTKNLELNQNTFKKPKQESHHAAKNEFQDAIKGWRTK